MNIVKLSPQQLVDLDIGVLYTIRGAVGEEQVVAEHSPYWVVEDPSAALTLMNALAWYALPMIKKVTP